MVAWPDLRCAGQPRVLGTSPRLDVARARLRRRAPRSGERLVAVPVQRCSLPSAIPSSRKRRRGPRPRPGLWRRAGELRRRLTPRPRSRTRVGGSGTSRALGTTPLVEIACPHGVCEQTKFFKGVRESVTDTITAPVKALAHPGRTVNGINYAVHHLGQTWDAIKAQYTAPHGEGKGRLVGDIFTTFLSLGEPARHPRPQRPRTSRRRRPRRETPSG